MARYTFVVTVETDPHDIDAPTRDAIANEIVSTLLYDCNNAIGNVDIRSIDRDYRSAVIAGGLE